MIYLARVEKDDPGSRLGVSSIAEATDSPQAFVAKILQQLVKAQLLLSFKGPNGGFVLDPGKKICLQDVVRCIDGDRFLKHCVLGFSSCSDKNPCPVHHKFSVLREDCKKNLLSLSVRDESLLKMTRVF